MLEITKENLIKNRFDVHIVENKKEAREKLLSEIPNDWSVGFGGSITLEEIGIYEELVKNNITAFWHWKTDDKKKCLEEARRADVYLSSANAITISGQILNTDGNGNRLAGLLDGHKRAFIVAGQNKIVKDLDSAFLRLKNIAAVMNTERLNLNTPCRETGACQDCDSKNRICNATLILHKCPKSLPTTVILVRESLGY